MILATLLATTRLFTPSGLLPHQPFVTACPPDEAMERWEATPRTFYNWHKAFLEMEQQVDEQGVLGETDFKADPIGSLGFGSPTSRDVENTRKSKSRAKSLVDTDSIVIYPSILKNTTTKDQLKRNPLNFGRLGKTIVALDEGLVGLAGSFQSFLTESRESTQDLSETSKMLALRISRTNNLVGSMSAIESSDYASPIVWSLLATMGSDVQTLLKIKVQLSAIDLKPLQGRVSHLEESMRLLTDILKLQVVSLETGSGTLIRKIETAVKRLITMGSGTSIDRGLEAALRASKGEGEEYTQNLEGRIKLKWISVCIKSWPTMNLSQ
jgi:hypothetical protein